MASRRPLSAAETLERIRTLHVSILESSLEVDKFLTSLNCLDLSSPRAASAASAAIVSALIFQDDFSVAFPRLIARAIAKLLQNDSEIVARSCLTPISLLRHTGHLPAVIARLADTFPDWTPRAQEMILSFVFSLGPRAVAEWAAFLPHMDLARSSPDEFLSGIADKFVSYLAEVDAQSGRSATNQPPDEPPSEEDDPKEDLKAASPPPAQEKLRRSFAFKRAGVETPGPLSAVPTSGADSLLPAKKPRPPEPPASARAKAPEKVPDAPSPGKRPPRRAVSVASLVQQMRDKDWERQQASVDMISEVLTSNPALLAANCKDIWLNLGDLVNAPRTTLALNSLRFAMSIFLQFPQQLAPSAAQFIGTALSLTCSSHQFIADAAAAALIAIAENSPRGRVWTPFTAGIKHKNPIARSNALCCILILLGQGPLDDREITALIAATAPLLRDPKAECRDSAKRILKALARDERFDAVARSALPKPPDFQAMKKVLDT
jgi:hypothetical protein